MNTVRYRLRRAVKSWPLAAANQRIKISLPLRAVGGGARIDVGQRAPDFTLLSDEAKPVTLSKELGQGPVILSFYVFDFTNTCQGQLCALRDSMGDLRAMGAKVFGISTDSHHSHRIFKEQNRLNYPLLSDWNRTVSRSYGVQYDRFGSFGLEGVAKRSVFVLDRAGVVGYKWVSEDPKIPPDPKKVLDEVAKLTT